MIKALASLDEKRGIAAPLPVDAPYHIPWRTPEDLRHFRDLTLGSTILMGRGTYETLERPLPGRRNVVASRSLTAVRDGFELVPDAEAFLQEAAETIWVIGGATLFETTLQYCDELYLTHVRGDYRCDRFFPPYADEFVLKEQSDWQVSGDITFRFAVYKRPVDL